MKPIAGDTVNYILESGPNAGQIRPAMVVRADFDAVVNLQVFTDGTNDSPDFIPDMVWKKAVSYSESHEYGTWHWISRDEAEPSAATDEQQTEDLKVQNSVELDLENPNETVSVTESTVEGGEKQNGSQDTGGADRDVETSEVRSDQDVAGDIQPDDKQLQSQDDRP
jgi:hypothetical protein